MNLILTFWLRPTEPPHHGSLGSCSSYRKLPSGLSALMNFIDSLPPKSLFDSFRTPNDSLSKYFNNKRRNSLDISLYNTVSAKTLFQKRNRLIYGLNEVVPIFLIFFIFVVVFSPHKIYKKYPGRFPYCRSRKLWHIDGLTRTCFCELIIKSAVN